MLVEPGKSFAQVATTVADNGINPDVAAFFTGIAISMYCPQMMGQISNGTFLNMLTQTGVFPAYQDCPAWPAPAIATSRSPARREPSH